MKRVLFILGLTLLFSSCGESEEEVEIHQEEVKKEMEEASDDLFDSLEDDLKEEEE